jgi:hypothetical protein
MKLSKLIKTDTLSELNDIVKEGSLDESSLSRILNHIENHDIAMMTAFRGKCEKCVDYKKCEQGKIFTKAENKQRNRQLQATLLQLGYGVTSVDGSYIENYGDESAKEVKEDSFFIVNNKDKSGFDKKIIQLGKIYCQDSVLIKPKGKSAFLYGTNKADFPSLNKKTTVGNFKGGAKSMFLSRVKNRPFVFDHFDYYNNMGKWAISAECKEIYEQIK